MNIINILAVLILISLAEAKNLRSEPGELRWMLREDEITRSRRGHKREGMSVYTGDNEIEYLVDGAEYISRLYEDMLRTRKGDFIHGMLFEESANFLFRPNSSDVPGSEKTSFRNMVNDAVERGVTIRLLVNCNLVEALWAFPFCVEMNLICGHTCCGLDSRHHNWVMGTLHTKMWVIKMGSETVVYNGGMDVAPGRWDTQRHDNSKERQMNGNYLGNTAIHDSGLRMSGPVVVDYERHFHQSWNDPYPAFFPFHFLPAYHWIQPPYVSHKESGLQVQLLRNLGCRGAQKGYYQNFAPAGETSSFHGLRKLIEEAKEFLYLEDQFFNYPEVLAVVKKRLPSLKFVIIVTNDQATPALFSNERYYMQYEALKLLTEDPQQAKKVFIYSLVRDTDLTQFIYLHSKIFIADDEYLIAGSFGVERSCLTNDQDVGMGIYDRKGKFVKEVRKRIWAEHLMLSENSPILENASRGLEEWTRQAEEGKGRARKYFPKKVEWSILCEVVKAVYETDGTCK